MGRMNKKGRSAHEPYIRLHRGVTNSEAWRSLSCRARALLIAIWSRHNGQNNGRISFSSREARENMRSGSIQTQKAFEDLQERGFLILRTPGSFHVKSDAGAGRASEWELTTEACDGYPAKRNYRKWKKNTVTASVTVANGRGNRSPSAN